jgi:hypothetical protein
LEIKQNEKKGVTVEMVFPLKEAHKWL